MKRKKSKNPGSHAEYWLSMADVLSALVLLLILLILLLCLRWKTVEEVQPASEAGAESHAVGLDDKLGWGDSWNNDDHRSGSSNGGGDGDIPEQVIPDGYDTGEKAAVKVIVIDAETKQTIEEKSVQFQLYSSRRLQKLSTYYPVKITYDTYETTDQGLFFLPEKIHEGTWVLTNLTAPTGYNLGENYEFSIERSYDWDDPYIVYFPMWPASRPIQIVQKDQDTGSTLAGGTYEIYAAEDITTCDGTVRYTSGQLVDTVTCDADGLATSQFLYLGNYEIRQTYPASTYAALSSPIEVKMDLTTTSTEPHQVEIVAEQTQMVVALYDELSGEAKPLAGVKFLLENNAGIPVGTFETNAAGRITLQNLQTNMTYTLRQTSWPDKYQNTATTLAFTVDASGKINGQAHAEEALTNRVIVLHVSAVDRLIHRSIKNEQMHLLGENGEVVVSWISSDQSAVIEGLIPGKYILHSDGGAFGSLLRKDVLIEIKDQKDIQYAQMEVLTIADCFLMLCAIGVLIGLAFFANRMIGKRIKNNKKSTHAVKKGSSHES